MTKQQIIKGFSKLSREEKIRLVIDHEGLPHQFEEDLNRYLHPQQQSLFNDISENTVSNYYLPFSLAPNFLINERLYIVPMVIEESSVVAAASKAASFWAKNGGFSTRIIDTIKNGQIFFTWKGTLDLLTPRLSELEDILLAATDEVTANMRNRGGGIVGFEFKAIEGMEDTYQLLVKFKTANSMGANFINTCLEKMAPELNAYINEIAKAQGIDEAVHIMSILSNYTPECVVECTVSCPIEQLAPYAGSYTPREYAQRFKTAVDIAYNDPYRAVTHNKGIFNGIDALVLATGNDFRAVEAGAQAYAARSGQYRGLTQAKLSNDHFTYTLRVPLALGTVGGLTNLHPMVKSALTLLRNPSAEQLMQIAASVGMANNFSAITALVTTGIQKGHMALHLSNILTSLGASKEEKARAQKEFANVSVSYSAVKNYLASIRK